MKKIKKKILLMCGSDLRNEYICSQIMKKYSIDGVVYQKRSKKRTAYPQKISSKEKKLFIRHFKERDASERKFFKNSYINLDNVENIEVIEKNINSNSVEKFLKKINPDIVILYGVGFLKKNILKLLPKKTINIHTGITPRFKGDACNFWAFYFLEPNNAGVTIHYVSNKVDSGPIITQIRPKLSMGDNMHDVSNKALKIAAKKVIKIISILKKKEITGVLKQGGKTFYSTNFKPYHLKMIYDYYDNKIVDLYLKKKINGNNQKLVKFL